MYMVKKCLKNILGMLPIWEIRMLSPDLLKKGIFGGVAQLKIMKENGAVVLHLHGK
jgi:hypothetical protein